MEIRHLNSFLAVAEAGSMSLASQRIGLTQSAISQQIKALEEHYGKTLFNRNGRELTLTEAGTILLPHARSIIRSIEDVKAEIAERSGRVEGVIRIGIGSFVEPYIRSASNRLMALYPNLHFDVKVYQAKTLNWMLRRHLIDVAFTLNNAYSHEHIESKPCVPMRICAVVNKWHELADRKMLSFDEIVNYPVIMPDEDQRSLETIGNIIKADLNKLNIKITINSADAALSEICEHNLMTFATPAHVVGRKDLVAIPIKGLEKDIWSNAHWMSDTYMKNSVRELLRIIKEETVPLYKSIEL